MSKESPAMEPTQLEQPVRAPSHPTGDRLERYALGQLVEPELEQVEAHLFVCPACQDALIETDQYVALMKSALAEPALVRGQVPWSSRWAAFSTWLGDAFRFPRPAPALTLALAALCMTVFLSQNYAPGGGDRGTEITLQAVRGSESLAQGPASQPLRLRLQSLHLRTDQPYQARVVDAAGQLAWMGQPEYRGGSGLTLQLNASLSRGTYWVRLYDAQQKLLQEYGLQLR